MKAFIFKRTETYKERFENFSGSRERFLELELEAIEKEADRISKIFETEVMESLNEKAKDGWSAYHECVSVDDFIFIIKDLKFKLGI